MTPTRQAVILVGGKGTRLGELAHDTPKPLLPLNENTAFLDEVLLEIIRFGFDDIILAAGHLGEQVAQRYHGRTFRGAQLRVVIETHPAGTGGALREIAPLLAPSFLLANGDTIFEVNLRELDRLLLSNSSAIGALALRSVDDAQRYGSVELRGQHIAAFREKQAASGSPGLINGGIGLFRRAILDRIDRLPCSIEAEVYPELAAAGTLLGKPFSGYFLDIGLPQTLATARRELPRRRPAVLLDRDGVIHEDSGYVSRVEDLRFIPGAVDAIRTINDLGALAIVVTNQAGVGRGYYELDEVDMFHAAIQAALADHGAHVDAFYTCPFDPDAKVAAFVHPDHPDRKPNRRMLLRAFADWPIDRARSFLVGDKHNDLEAARRAGIPGLLFEGGNLNAFLHGRLLALAAVDDATNG